VHEARKQLIRRLAAAAALAGQMEVAGLWPAANNGVTDSEPSRQYACGAHLSMIVDFLHGVF